MSTLRKESNRFEVWLKETFGDEYRLKGKYINRDTFMTLEHLPCGHCFATTEGRFENGERCPYCQREKEDIGWD